MRDLPIYKIRLYRSFRNLKTDSMGFTLVELLVSVSIIILLVVVLVPVFLNYVDRAREARTIKELVTIKTVLDSYVSLENNGKFPSKYTIDEDEYIGVILQKKGINWRNAYTPGGITNPWGIPYFYMTYRDTKQQQHYMIFTMIPNRKTGGSFFLTVTDFSGVIKYSEASLGQPQVETGIPMYSFASILAQDYPEFVAVVETLDDVFVAYSSLMISQYTDPESLSFYQAIWLMLEVFAKSGFSLNTIHNLQSNS